MEFGTIEREIYVEASPEVVFEVVSSPEHLKQWWPDDARYEVTPGSVGEIVFGDRDADGAVVPFTVVDAGPPRRFSFRWTHPADVVAAEGNSLLVTFELTPSSGGTLLKMTETGFREMGWEAAVLEEQYAEHVKGWAFYPAAARPVRGDAAGAAVSTAVAERVDDELWSAVGDPTRRRLLDLLLSRGRRYGDQPERGAAGHPPGRRQASRSPGPRRPGPRHGGRPGAALQGRRRPARPRRRAVVRGRGDLGRASQAHQADRRDHRARSHELAARTRDIDHNNPDTQGEGRHIHGGHPASGRYRVDTRERLRRHHDHRGSGGLVDREHVRDEPTSAASSASASAPAGSTWRSSNSSP